MQWNCAARFWLPPDQSELQNTTATSNCMRLQSTKTTRPSSLKIAWPVRCVRLSWTEPASIAAWFKGFRDLGIYNITQKYGKKYAQTLAGHNSENDRLLFRRSCSAKTWENQLPLMIIFKFKSAVFHMRALYNSPNKKAHCLRWALICWFLN